MGHTRDTVLTSKERKHEALVHGSLSSEGVYLGGADA